jgi:hypothetical protein
MVRTIVAPTAVPATLPLGCLPNTGAARFEEIVRAGPGAATVAALDEAAVAWWAAAEDELALIRGLSGKCKANATGRAAGPRVVWRTALGSPGSSCARTSPATSAWRAVAAWLAPVQHTLAANERDVRYGAVAVAAQKARNKLLDDGRWSRLGCGLEAKRFIAWIAAVTRPRLFDRAAVAALRTFARAAAEEGVRRDAAASYAAWRSWLQEGPGRGLRRQHRLSRIATGWAASPVAPSGSPFAAEDSDTSEARRACRRGCAVAPLGAQQAADAQCEAWSREWLVGAAPPPPTPAWPQVLGDTLPAHSVAAFRCACASFPHGVGLGWDRVHPRALLRLSAPAITALLRIFLLAELVGMWPKNIGCVLVVLIDKSDGGLRPIGLLPTLVRVWSRVRLVVAQQWQQRNERPYFYAGPARSAVRAAWCQAAQAEAAHAAGTLYGLATLDLKKAFERVPWDHLVFGAVRSGFNLYLLRLSLAAYALEKAILVDGACSAFVRGLRGITAGSTFATIELRVLLLTALDSVAASSRVTTLTVYVDDVSVEAVGPFEVVMRQWPGAIRSVVEQFEAMRLDFSDTKNMVIASTHRLAAAAVTAAPSAMLHITATTKSLGVGQGAGVRRAAAASAKRTAAFVARRGRFVRLIRAGANAARLLRTGGLAAMTYGVAVMGLSPSALMKQRRAAAAALAVTNAGGDLDLTLALAGADPAVAAHAEPIGTWAMAAWESWVPRCTMLRSVASAAQRLGKARNVWNAVHGPAAAMVATATRLGWTVQDAFTATTDLGSTVRFTQDAPLRIRAVVAESVQRWRNRRIAGRIPTLATGGNDHVGPFFQPVVKLLEARTPQQHDWGWPERAALKSAFLNRQWPQQRVFAAKLSLVNACQLCDALRPGEVAAAGTALHRVAQCPCLEPLRLRLMPLPLLEAARVVVDSAAAGHSVDAAWVTRALVQSPACAVPLPPEASHEWHVELLDFAMLATATLYSDGSMIDGPPKYAGLCARLGWAFALMSRDGAIIAAASGRPPPWIRSVPGAEAWALLQAAVAFGSTPRFRVDCFALVQMYERGWKHATGAGNASADIWASLRTAWDAEDDVDLVWMPAHTAERDVGVATLSDGSLLSAFDRAGNAEADRLAKAAAAGSRVPSSCREAVLNLASLVTQQARWVGQVTCAANHFRVPGLPEDDEGSYRRDSTARDARARAAHTEHTSGGRGRLKRPRCVVEPRPVQLGGHQRVRRDGRWFCLACRAFSRLPRFASQRCRGSAVQAWAERASADAERDVVDGGGHARRLTGPVLWCERCGAYADRCARGLTRPCAQWPANAAAEARRERLRRRLHPVTGEYLADVTVVEPSSFLEAAGAGTVAATLPHAGGAESDRMLALRARVRARQAAAEAQ